LPGLPTPLTEILFDPMPEYPYKSAHRKWTNWLISIGIWTLVALLIASLQFTARPLVTPRELTFDFAMIHVSIWAYFWACATFLIFAIVRKYSLDKSALGKTLAVHGGFALVCILVLSAIYTVGEFFWNREESIKDGPLLVFAKVIVVMLTTNLLTYFCIVAVGQTLDLYRKYREREFKATRLETELVSAQLNQLRSQLHPHFLFNTLSAITTLIYEDSEAAEKMVVRLSELLRMALEQPDSQTRSLEDELAFISKYLEIETIRFGDRLDYTEDIHKSARNAQVPVLILQPLIENALKHAVERSRGKCKVMLSATANNTWLNLVVSDSGPGRNGTAARQVNSDNLFDKHTHPNGNGIGLSNTRSRLEHLYPNNHRMSVKDLQPGFQVEIDIPLKSENANE
jgi:two-component system, LytTR family, sensor kinase